MDPLKQKLLSNIYHLFNDDFDRSNDSAFNDGLISE
jgi:hypothetical protein